MANNKLDTYKAKRDFGKTREPSGQDPVKPTTRRRFVIQKHDATRLHYDLRLELDGVRKAGREKKASTITTHELPDFVAPQLCETLDRPPSADGWIHEIKFDGYRIQMRVLDGEVALKTCKGLD